jgi:hypothetical protein
VGKRFKFSPLKARILMMIGPVISAIFFGLYSCSFIYYTLKEGLSFWLDMIRDNFMFILFFIWIHMSLVESIYRMIKNNLLLNSNIQELRGCYPELEDSWDYLNDADYLDKDLQVLVYGDHLIHYGTFEIVYLPECRELFPNLRVTSRDPIGFSVTCNDGSRYDILMHTFYGSSGYGTDKNKKELLAYIEENYPHINKS